MVVISVFILLIISESSRSNAFNTYCSLPCPFTGPAQPPCSYGAIQLPPRRPRPMARSSFYDAYTDYDEIPEGSQPQPPPNIRSRQQPAKPDPPPPASPPPKPKPKPPPEDPEPPQKKRSSSPPSSPCIQPSRRFFTSLFSIPGAVVDTMIGGEVVL